MTNAQTHSAAQWQTDLAALAERLRQSTVEVSDHRGRANRGGGSGVIWRSDGLIVTNAHVAVEREAKVRLADGRSFTVAVAGRDRARDLALLKLPARDLPAASVGDSDHLRAGELAVAVGNPLGYVGALASGIIHSSDARWVRADVRLAPGNSGGLLANARGEVVGINSLIANGLAHAIPSRAVEQFVARALAQAVHKNGHKRPRLGITYQPVSVPVAAAFSYQQRLGLLLLNVEPNSPAARAGLLLGDVLLAATGRGFERPEDLAVALDGAATGGVLELELMRGERWQRVTASFGATQPATGRRVAEAVA